MIEILENTDEVRKNPFADRLEQAFKDRYDCKYAIALNSGASGLHAAMHAVGVGPGDEIITSPFSVLWFSNCYINGSKCKICRCKYGLITLILKNQTINQLKTKAIIPVSYHGLPCDIDEINKIGRENKIAVIEDNAQTMLGGYKNRLAGQIWFYYVFIWAYETHNLQREVY